MTAVALRFDQVVKRFDRRAVLAGIDLEVLQGEFFALVGMNGAGKTTLIKSLLDFCTPDSGTIQIAGIDSRRTQARAPLVFLPERLIPPYYLTGGDFLRYMLKLHGIAYDPGPVGAALSALDFDPAALNRTVRLYSKGMTQKLGLAVCFLARKELLVLDEPMSGLDPKARAALKLALVQLRDRGATLFFSSHALADVEQLCDRMAILHEGRLRFVGTPDACRARYGAATLEAAYLSCIGEPA